MSADSEPIITKCKPDDFMSIMLETIGGIQFKLIAIMLVVFIFISTDTFINRALARFPGAVDYKCPTSYGTCLQGLFMAIAMIIFDGLIRQKII